MSNQELAFREAWKRWSGVISLRGVQLYLANRLVDISKHLTECRLTSINTTMTSSIQSADATMMAARLHALAGEAEDLSLPMTAKLARRMAETLNAHSVDTDFFEAGLDSLESRFEDEIEDRKLFLVKPELFGFYQNTELAGEQFKSNFPRGNIELIEAANCLVLDRHTACVFHLMRALDIALNALQADLGIPLPSNLAARTWGRTLERIKVAIDAHAGSPDKKEFYATAYTFIQAVKAPFRDTTMHVESSYDQASAQSVFNVALEVLKHLATHLKE
jgi:hypothetical protein